MKYIRPNYTLIWWKLFSAIILVIVTITVCTSREMTIEEKVRGAVNNALHNDSISQINLSRITEKKISQLCFQTPYITKSKFEEVAKKDIKDFYQIEDNKYILWVFFTDGSVFKTEIDRWKQMDKSRNSQICAFSSPKLLVVHDKGKALLIIQGDKKWK